MQRKIRIIADSSANLESDKPGIASVPLRIVAGDREYVDGDGRDVERLQPQLERDRLEGEVLSGEFAVEREGVEQHQAVLAAGDAHGDAIPRLDHAKVLIRLADTPQNRLHLPVPPVFEQR